MSDEKGDQPEEQPTQLQPATFHREDQEHPLRPDDPIQQSLFDRLPIPQSKRKEFFEWLITEEYDRQKQQQPSKRDDAAPIPAWRDEGVERPETVLQPAVTGLEGAVGGESHEHAPEHQGGRDYCELCEHFPVKSTRQAA